jgi:hypothetical protein
VVRCDTTSQFIEERSGAERELDWIVEDEDLECPRKKDHHSCNFAVGTAKGCQALGSRGCFCWQLYMVSRAHLERAQLDRLTSERIWKKKNTKKLHKNKCSSVHSLSGFYRGGVSAYLDGIVVADADQHVLRGVPRHLLDVLRVPVQHRHALEVVPRFVAVQYVEFESKL